MAKTVHIEIDENLEGSVSFTEGDEYEIDHILGSVGLNASAPRPRPRSRSLRLVTIEASTIEASTIDALDRPLLRKRLEAAGFDVRDASTL
ncbi:hypothetical protein [Paramicrobacterium fandaimingii]|uniref:hypothetical protein n=1 Tax=Paramicrobacterium fandaimingii TaxID=2708079 RepID=UPI0014235A09|nr:hypothetical protein [Microbacterium fandaimingii]